MQNVNSYSFENGLAGKYAIFNLEDQGNLLQYQIHMIENICNNDYVVIDKRVVDNKSFLYYSLKNKVPLEQYLNNKKLSSKEGFYIVQSILKILKEAKSYLLMENKFFIENKMIFIDTQNTNVSLVYLPFIDYEEDNIKKVKKVIETIIVNCGNGKDEYYYTLKNLLIEINRQVTSFETLYKSTLQLEINNDASSTNTTHKSGVSKNFKKPEKIRAPKEKRANISNIQKKQFEIPTTKEAKVHVESKQKNDSETKNLKPIIYLQVLVIFILFAIIKAEIINKGDYASYVAVALIFGAIDFMIVRKLLYLSPNKYSTNTPVEKNYIKESENFMEMRDVEQLKTELLFSPSDETILLSAEGKLNIGEKNSFKIVCENSQKVIPVDKPIFVLGRQKSQVDHEITCTSVGKIHAHLLKKHEALYIKDINSKNGTYLNDVRLESDVEYELKENDRITLANMNYIINVAN